MENVLISWSRDKFIASIHAENADFMSYCCESVSEHELATKQLEKLFYEANIPLNGEILLQATLKFLFIKTIVGMHGRYLSHSDSHILLFIGSEPISIKWESIETLVA